MLIAPKLTPIQVILLSATPLVTAALAASQRGVQREVILPTTNQSAPRIFLAALRSSLCPGFSGPRFLAGRD